MNGPLVSIIVPAYNVEAYLPECLDSLISQTLEDIEIVCVNDASTDGSLAILRQYAARDARIRVIDQATNEGLSVARNVGIAMATGRWLAFVDSDDFVDPDLCRKALACAGSSAADLVIYDYAAFRSDVDLAREQSLPSQLTGMDPRDTAALLALNAYAWLKLVRAEHLRALGVQFPPGMTYEDLPFHWDLLARTERVALLPERLYFYRQRQGSIGYRRDWSRADYTLAFDLVLAALIAHGLYPRYQEVFLRQRLKSFMVLHDTIAPAHRRRVRGLVRERMDEDHWKAVENDRLLDRGTRDFLLALRGAKLPRLRRGAWLAARWIHHALRTRTADPVASQEER